MVRFFIFLLIKSKKAFFLVLIFCLAAGGLKGQDIHFTLFNSNPLYLNPANTGNFDGNWRLAANYRNQWGAASNPYKTASLSFDKPFYLGRNKLAGGLFIVNDNSGIGGLTFNNIYGSLGYEKEIDNNYFNAGLQVGYVFGKVNSWKVWDDGAGDFTALNESSNFNEKTSFIDINAGLCWKRNIGIYEPEVGMAFMHVNTPKKSFFGSSEKENIKSVIHAKVKTKINDNLFVVPAILYNSKNKTSLTMLGTDIGYTIFSSSQVKQIYTGFYLRNGILEKADSFSALIGATVGNIDIAFSYDSNISNFSKTAGKMGAFEISLIITNMGSVLNTYSIPCERY